MSESETTSLMKVAGLAIGLTGGIFPALIVKLGIVSEGVGIQLAVIVIVGVLAITGMNLVAWRSRRRKTDAE